MFHGSRSLIQTPALLTCSEGASFPHPHITAGSLPVYSQVIPKAEQVAKRGALTRKIGPNPTPDVPMQDLK
jgi:hypothetical protein